MYITVTKSGKNKKNAYVKLVEAYRVDGKKRERTVQCFGRLDDLTKEDPQALEKLKAKYSQEREAKKKATVEARLENVNRVMAISNEAAFAETPAPLLHYGHYALHQVWDEDLGLTQKIDYLQKTSGSRAKFKFSAVARHMACLKVMDPSSVLFGFGHQDDFVGDPLRGVTLDNCYETLGFLKENKDKIFRWVNKKMDAMVGENRATLVFYDVTNVYFETPLTDAEKDYEQADFGDRVQAAANRMREDGTLPDECFDRDGMVIPEVLPDSFWEEDANDRLQYLRMRGPSKEHRTDLPLVSIALVIDKCGFPMDFEIYAGNASEFKTMHPSIQKLKDKYNIKNAIVVADRGLNSVKNLKMLHELGLGFLVAQKVTNLSAELTKQMLDLSKYSPFNPKDPDSGKYQVIPNWQKTGNNGEAVDCMLLLTYNEKRKNRDNRILDAMIDIVKKKAADGAKIGPRKSGWAALAKTAGDADCPVLGVDEKVVAKKRQFCGFAAVVYEDSPDMKAQLNPTKDKAADKTDDKADNSAVAEDSKKEPVRMLNGRDVAAQYPKLNRIEDSFRVMKSHLGLRPMYVRNSDHIRGHITVCVLSLLMIRLVQRRLELAKTPLSISEICSTLGGACVAAIRANDTVMFCHTGHQANIRKGRETKPTGQLLSMLREGKVKTTLIPDIMRACGLKPLLRFSSLQELGASLRVRFGSPDDAIPVMRLETV